MAARELTENSCLQLWTEWSECRGINIDDNLENDKDLIDINHKESHATKLQKKDMKLFSSCPFNDETYLVVCEDCNPKQQYKPQNLKHHYEVRHPNIELKAWSQRSKMKPPYSRTPVITVSPSQNRTLPPKHHGRNVASTSNSNHSSPAPVFPSPSNNPDSKSFFRLSKTKENNKRIPILKVRAPPQTVQITPSLNTHPISNELPSAQKPPTEIPIRTNVVCSTKDQNAFSNSTASTILGDAFLGKSNLSIIEKPGLSFIEKPNLSFIEKSGLSFIEKSGLPINAKGTNNQGKPSPKKDPEHDSNIHCGISSIGKPCTKSLLLCEKVSMQRNVDVRSKNDILLSNQATVLKLKATKRNATNKVIGQHMVHVTTKTMSNIPISPISPPDTPPVTIVTTTTSTTITNNILSAIGLPTADKTGANNQPMLSSIVPSLEANMPTVSHQTSPNINHYEEDQVAMDIETNDTQGKSHSGIEIPPSVQPVTRQEPLHNVPVVQEKSAIFDQVKKFLKARYHLMEKPIPAHINHYPSPYAVSTFGLKRLENGPIVASGQFTKMREAFRLATSVNKIDKPRSAVKVPVISRVSPVATSQESELIGSYPEPSITLPPRRTKAFKLMSNPRVSPIMIEQEIEKENINYSETSIILPLHQATESQLNLIPIMSPIAGVIHEETDLQTSADYSNLPIILPLKPSMMSEPISSPVTVKQRPTTEYQLKLTPVISPLIIEEDLQTDLNHSNSPFLVEQSSMSVPISPPVEVKQNQTVEYQLDLTPRVSPMVVEEVDLQKNTEYSNPLIVSVKPSTTSELILSPVTIEQMQTTEYNLTPVISPVIVEKEDPQTDVHCSNSPLCFLEPSTPSECSSPPVTVKQRQITESQFDSTPVISSVTVGKEVNPQINTHCSDPTICFLEPSVTTECNSPPSIKQTAESQLNLTQVISVTVEKGVNPQMDMQYSNPPIVFLEHSTMSECISSPVTVQQNFKSSDNTNSLPLEQLTPEIKMTSVTSPISIQHNLSQRTHSKISLSEINSILFNNAVMRASNDLSNASHATASTKEMQSISKGSVSNPKPKTSRSRRKYSSEEILNGPPSKRKCTSVPVVHVPNGMNLPQVTVSPSPRCIKTNPLVDVNEPISLPSAFPHTYYKNSATVLTKHSSSKEGCLQMPDIRQSTVPQFNNAAHTAQSNDFVSNYVAINEQRHLHDNVHSLTMNSMPLVDFSNPDITLKASPCHSFSQSPCPLPEDLSMPKHSNKHSITAILSKSTSTSSTAASNMSNHSKTASTFSNCNLQNTCLTNMLNNSNYMDPSTVTNSVFSTTYDMGGSSNCVQVNNPNITNSNSIADLMFVMHPLDNRHSQNVSNVSHYLDICQGNNSAAVLQSSTQQLPSPVLLTPPLLAVYDNPAAHVSTLHNGLTPTPPGLFNHIAVRGFNSISPPYTISHGREPSDDVMSNVYKGENNIIISESLPIQSAVSAAHSTFQLSLPLTITEIEEGDSPSSVSKLKLDQSITLESLLSKSTHTDGQVFQSKQCHNDDQLSETVSSVTISTSTVPLKNIMPSLPSPCQMKLPSEILKKNGMSNSDSSFSIQKL